MALRPKAVPFFKCVRFKVSRDGKILGEYDFLEVVDALAEGRFSGKDYFWSTGMHEWKRLSDFAEYNKEQAGKSPSAPDFRADGIPDGRKDEPSARSKKRSLFKGLNEDQTTESRSQTDHARRMIHESPARGDAHVSSEPRCPSCSSKSVQACGMGFAAGTRTSESLGISSRGRAYFRTGRSSSILASALAPPSKGGANPVFALMLLGGLVGGAFWFAKYGTPDWYGKVNQMEKWSALFFVLLIIGGGLWGVVASSAESDKEHSEAMRKWEKQWFCKKCGAIFTPRL